MEDEDFFGKDLSKVEAESKAYEFVKLELLREEPELFQTKWFDYRLLHPTVATYYFGHCYTQAYKNAYQKTKCEDRGKYVRGFKGKDIFELSGIERTGFWKARQAADRIGCDYSFFIQEAMNFTLAKNWRALPRPQQLYSTDMIAFIDDKWIQKLNSRIVVPKSLFFSRGEEFIGNVDQIDFQRFLAAQIKAKAHPVFALYDYLVDKKMLVESYAIEGLGQQLVNQVKIKQ
jgi:hypothetical protein